MVEVSLVIPAYNEAASIANTIGQLERAFDKSGIKYEVIVVDDGSKDDTFKLAAAAGAQVHRHPCNIGYGNALLAGIQCAKYPLIAITDADGTYPIEELPSMVKETSQRGLDMLVGARQGRLYYGSIYKRFARMLFKNLAEFACGRKIPDVNSGLRVMRRDLVMQFTNVLSGGFSFTTTLTLVSILSARFVDYRPIKYHARVGKSHVRYLRDSLRTLQLLVMNILIFNPIKLFLLGAMLLISLGVVVTALVAAFPQALNALAVFSLYVLGGAVTLAMGLWCEQRRATPPRGLLARERSEGNLKIAASRRP